MDLLVKYSEIHTKKGKTRSQLTQNLRQRVQDRLRHENIPFEKVSAEPGRIIARNTTEEAKAISELPGVEACALAHSISPQLNKVKEKVDLDVGQTFGVRVNSRTNQSSSEWERKIGTYIQEKTGKEVDLDHPETWIRVELTSKEAFVYSSKTEYKGPGGLPAASQGSYISLISGGIDSPVAAFEVMKRGADIFPLYFYNRPFAAEDHLIRFEAVLNRLKDFHPSKKWKYAVVDLKEVNEELSEVDKGRMVLHRRLMFEVAEKLREEKDAAGIVTGEAIAQKSSQTPQNMFITSNNLPVIRPLSGRNKNEITDISRRLGTYEYATVDSACRSISPDSPSTELSKERFNQLKSQVNFEELVEKAFESLEVKEI